MQLAAGFHSPGGIGHNVAASTIACSSAERVIAARPAIRAWGSAFDTQCGIHFQPNVEGKRAGVACLIVNALSLNDNGALRIYTTTEHYVITVISQQGASGAHDEDLLGTITVYGNLVGASDITVDNASVYGAYDKVGELPVGVHFKLEDDGILANGASDGGHHDEGAMIANMSITNHT
jgi:hypothetical protein